MSKNRPKIYTNAPDGGYGNKQRDLALLKSDRDIGRKAKIGLFSPLLPDGYAMLMRPNKAETAVHGCHRPGDMVARMRYVLARPADRGLVFECVTCF